MRSPEPTERKPGHTPVGRQVAPQATSGDPREPSYSQTLPALSIVLVSFNTRALLRQCLLSLRTWCDFAEVIVVDNDSHDGSPEMVSAEFPESKLIRLNTNAGFAAANNVGMAQSTGEFVLLLNSDTVVEDDSLIRCLLRMQTQRCLGALSPALTGQDGRPQAARHRYPHLSDMAREALRLAPRSHDSLPDSEFWLAGTCLMIRREALDGTGGMLDDRLFMYWEDADLCRRLQDAGWSLDYFEEAAIRHYGGASGGGADEHRRPDLHAWYQYGRHHWFRQHRPRWHSVCLSLLELCDVPRLLLRSVARPAQQQKRQHAVASLSVLIRRLFGLAPKLLPGAGRLTAGTFVRADISPGDCA